MPIYVQKCENGHEFDVFLPMSDYRTNPDCECGAKSRRKIVPTMISCDIAPWDAYESPSSGKLITSYAERREDMKRTDCVDYEPSLIQEKEKADKKREAKLEKSFDDSIEKQISKMDAPKREKLYNEMTHTDLNYTRLAGDT